MKRNVISLALTMAMCLGLAITPVSAAKTYTDDWGTKFSNVLYQDEESFIGYSGRKGDKTIYYLDPESEIHIGKRADKMGYLEIDDDDEISMLRKETSLDTRDITYTRDEFEDEFGVYDMYCLLTRTNSWADKNAEYECLYFLFDDSEAEATRNFVLQNKGTVLEKYRGSSGKLAVPDGVVQIKGMFMDMDTAASVTSLTLPSSVREIEGWTFNNCSELFSVVLPAGLQKLGDCAFTGCTGLNSVTVPGSLTEIGSNVFSDCGLSRVTLQPGLKTIGSSMFSNCTKLVVLNVPSSVTQVGSRAFAGCTSLTSVVFENGNTQIEEDAFDKIRIPGLIQQGPQLTFSAPSGGTVEAYCAAKGIAFRSTGSVPGNTAPTVPTSPAGPASASPTNDSLTADSVLQTPTVYKINDSNYFKIRDLAAILNGTGKQFSVGYDSALQSVTATTGAGYQKTSADLTGAPAGGQKTAESSNDAIYINGKKIEAEVYKIDGSNYFKLRDLGKALNFYVGYSSEHGMFIESGKPYSE